MCVTFRLNSTHLIQLQDFKIMHLECRLVTILDNDGKHTEFLGIIGTKVQIAKQTNLLVTSKL